MSVQISVDHNTAGAGATQINNVTNNIAILDEHSIRRACLKALRCPDPFEIKNRLKKAKDELLRDSFQWILSNEQYCKWQNGDNVSLLWIKGGAGKGKTMMSIGLVEALSQREPNSNVVTYFFCQNADTNLNTVTAVIKGLIICLVEQREILWQVLLKRWDIQNACFEQEECINQWETLWNIFLEMVSKCQSYGDTVFVVVDALDECLDDGMSEFLLTLVRTGLDSPGQLKWLLTSRPLEKAESYLLKSANRAHVSFELNPELIAMGITIYIHEQIRKLIVRKKVDYPTYHAVAEAMQAKSNGTFLWVSLLCKELQLVSPENAMSIVTSTPPELQDLYAQAYTKYTVDNSEIGMKCTQMLAVLMLAYQPLNFIELIEILGLPAGEIGTRILVSTCSTFVTTRIEDGIEYVEFVHQSARDYLAGLPKSAFDHASFYTHEMMASRCLSILSTLNANLFHCSDTAASREAIVELGEELTSKFRYAAEFWAIHLEAIDNRESQRLMLRDNGKVHCFLRCYFLEWLECLSVIDQLQSASEGLDILMDILNRAESKDDFEVVPDNEAQQLRSFSPRSKAPESASALLSLLQDERRFLSRYFNMIAGWPLQIYSSAMIFSPSSSKVRQDNLDKKPEWLQCFPEIQADWSPLRQNLIGHSSYIHSVTFSPNGKLVASTGTDATLKLWSVQTGQLQQILEYDPSWIRSVAFSPDGDLLASGSHLGTIELWSMQTGQAQQTLKGCMYPDWVMFSPDGAHVASTGEDSMIQFWSVQTGRVEYTLGVNEEGRPSVALSPDWQLLAVASNNRTIKLWSTETKQIQSELQGHSARITSVTFSPDGQLVGSTSSDRTVKLWSVQSRQLQRTLTGHTDFVMTVVFSPDGRLLASGSEDNTVRLWSVQTGHTQQRLLGHNGGVRSVAFSPNGQLLASGGHDSDVKLWSIQTRQVQHQALKHHSRVVISVMASPNGQLVASGGMDGLVMLWSVQTGKVQQILTENSSTPYRLAFSPDAKMLAVCDANKVVTLWSLQTGQIQQILENHSRNVYSIVFSPNGQLLASIDDDFQILKLWSVRMGQVQQSLKSSSSFYSAAFSPDGQLLASGHVVDGHGSGEMKLWSVRKCLKVESAFKRHFTSHESRLLIRTIQCTWPCCTIRFNRDGTQLISDSGRFYVSNGERCEEFDLRHVDAVLVYQEPWIYCGSIPLLYIPSDYRVSCQHSCGDTIALGCRDGRVLCFRIDRDMSLSNTNSRIAGATETESR